MILTEQFIKATALLISIFTALISGFKDISYDDKVFYLKKYIAVFTSELKKKNIYIKYTTDNNIIDKKIIMKDIKNYEKIENFNNFIIFLTMFFDVNIFIIDNDNINLYSINYYFNIFKYSIILKKIAEDKYNIIKFNNETLFSYINNEEFKNFIDVKTQQIKSFKQNSRLEYITDNFIIQYDKDIEHYENSFSSIQEINKSKMYKNKKCVEEKQENTQTDIQTDTQEEIKGTMTLLSNYYNSITDADIAKVKLYVWDIKDESLRNSFQRLITNLKGNTSTPVLPSEKPKCEIVIQNNLIPLFHNNQEKRFTSNYTKKATCAA